MFHRALVVARQHNQRPAPCRAPRRQTRARCMRYESCVTSLSWIPSEAVTGCHPDGVRLRVHALRRPASGGARRPRGAAGGGPVPLRERLQAWIEVDDGRIAGRGYDGGGDDGRHHDARRRSAPHLPGRRAARPAARRSIGDGWMRFVQTTGGRTARPRAPAGAAPALRPVAGAAGVDDAVAHPARRRRRAEPRWSGASRFPRHWVYGDDGKLAAQVRADRLRQTGPRHVVRPPHAVGRRGLPGPGDRGRDRAGAGAVGAPHARWRQAADHAAPGRRRSWSARATAGRTSTWCWTG